VIAKVANVRKGYVLKRNFRTFSSRRRATFSVTADQLKKTTGSKSVKKAIASQQNVF